MKLRHAKKIDFTGTVTGFAQFPAYGDDVAKLIRDRGREEAIIVIDHGFAMQYDACLVLDHLNLTGDNPLVGPNDPIGPRFPVVNNIYVAAADTIDQEETWAMGNPLGQLHNGIAAGVKNGLRLDDEDLQVIKKLGAHFYCWNLVPAMIVAAHAGLRVLALAIPEGKNLDERLVQALSR